MQVCTQYGQEYNVIFNPDKTKLVHIDNAKLDISPCISFIGKRIVSVEFDKHLGIPVGNVKRDSLLVQAIHNFTTKVNMVKSHFKLLPTDVLYKLFKAYCMPLYGCPLWDLSDKLMSKFYVAWRKAVRYILGLPRQTHCNLLHDICLDMPITDQLFSRFHTFFKSLLTSKNQLTNMCARLALQGSGSSVSNNILVVSNRLSISRCDFPTTNLSINHMSTQNISNTSSLIRDLLCTKYQNSFKPKDSGFLTDDDVNFSIIYLCTS